MDKGLEIGTILAREKVITLFQLEQALKLLETSQIDESLEDLLIRLNYLSEKQLAEVVAKVLKLPFVDLRDQTIGDQMMHEIDETLARKYRVIPVAKDGNKLTVAMYNPLNLYAIETLRLYTQHEIEIVIATKTQIQNTIEKSYSGRGALLAAEELTKVFEGKKGVAEVAAAVVDDIGNAPIVKMVNAIVEQAVRLNASDIHIEPCRQCTLVRMRIDGELQESMQLNKHAHDGIITRIKLVANMNIAEKRLPQDGRFEWEVEGKKVYVRVSVLPTAYGEKIVIRLLDTQGCTLLSIDELGFTSKNRQLFDTIITNNTGIILVTGPTGSGKSTTLYAVLNERNRVTDNIVTLEDPIEKKIDGINQVQINNKAGLTFANGLRAILRQDPDVMMIGEIRDKETANIAIRSAITGHLVFSTLHTNDAASSMTRLVDMEVEPYLVASALVGVIAQRLVRRICENCKVSYKSTPEEMSLLQLDQPTLLHKGVGCLRCNHTGFKGRQAIHEIIVVDREIRQMIHESASSEAISAYAKQQGTQLLSDTMKEIILKGESTISEYLKRI